MRRWSTLAAALAVAGMSARAGADEVTASGSLGAGVFAGQAALTAELGVDAAGDGYAVGLGAGARWLAGGGFRAEDWDEASEWARVVRYALVGWPRGGEPTGGQAGEVGEDQAGDDRAGDDRAGRDRGAGPDAAWMSAALGELGGVTVGHGSLVDGYAGGLDVDHGRVGVQASAGRGRMSGELVVDDVIAPRIAGARLARRAGRRFTLGVSAAGDRTAPSSSGAAGGPAASETDSEAVAGLAVDGEIAAASESGRARGAMQADLVHIVGLGAGLHLGARGQILLGEMVRVAARGELRAATDEYVPGWIGPLYERDRRELRAASGSMTGGQLDAARAGGLGGLGAAGEIELEARDLVGVAIGWAGRPGLADLVTARLAAPHRAGLQAALWAAAEVDGRSAEAMALAIELRVRLPGRWFVRGDVARLYREQQESGSYQPVWLGQIALGSVLGEARAR